MVRDVLRALSGEEREFEAKLAALRAAIDEGDASGTARGNVFARVRKSPKLPMTSLTWALSAVHGWSNRAANASFAFPRIG